MITYTAAPDVETTVGDRTLTAFKPPVFDNPATTGFHDDKSGILFSSDCFGALLAEVPGPRPSSPRATSARVSSSGPRSTRRGCTTWTPPHFNGR